MDSYEAILNRMKDKYTELSGYKVPELSDTDIRMKLLAGEIYNSEVNLEFLRRQMFVATASGEYLSMHAADRGLSRRKASKASGTVRFSVNELSAENVTIPAGTVVATSGNAYIRFLTDADVTLNAGSYSVGVRCTAETGGEAGNVAANTISLIVTDVPGIDRVANAAAFSGGADAESDEHLRKRVLDSYVTIDNGTNAAYYKRLALTADDVRSVNVKPMADGVGTVDVYLGGYGVRVPGTTVTKISNLINSQRELNVRVTVYAADVVGVNVGIEIKLKPGYDFLSVKSDVTAAINEFFSQLEVGESITAHRLGRVILGVEGVYDYGFLDGENAHFDIDDSAFAVLASLLIREDT